jgi:beta-glucosidase
MHHVLLAHGLSAQSIKSVGNSKLGIVLNLTEAQSVSTDPADLVAQERLDGIHNRWFLDAIIKGVYPEDILKELGKYMPADFEEDMKLISAPIDWLGINYYTRGIVASDPSTPWPSIKNVDGPLEKTQMGWEIYPDGLKNLLVRLSRDYTGKLPLMITENGMAWADQLNNGSVCDGVRSDYISAHLGAAKAAIDAGVNLKGFFYWSLLDNFEWAFGYGKRFGLVHVDYETQRRTPKASYHDWAASLKS